MADGLKDLLQEAKKNKHSPFWNSFTEADALIIWNNVATFVGKTMMNQKGVNIPGFGTFTFSQVKLDVGGNKFLLIQRPIFQLNEKFTQTLGLHQNKRAFPGAIPVVPLNFSQLSQEIPYDRDTIEQCIREIVGALTRSVASNRQIDLTFPSIGRLQVHGSKAKVIFFKNFVNRMEGSGKLVESLQGRPGTADSVMSERCTSRLNRVNSVLDDMIPNAQHMPVISEEEEFCDQAELKTDQLRCDQDEHFVYDDDIDNCDENFETTGDFVDVNDAPKMDSSYPNRIPLVMPQASVVNFADELPSTLQQENKIIRMTFGRENTSPIPKHSSHSPINLSPIEPMPSMLPNFHRPSSESDVRHSAPCFGRDMIPPPPRSAVSSCRHSNSGQELCYVCHQRARRNVVVSFAEERRQREEEEDKLRRAYQQTKDTEANVKEQEKLLARRFQNQQNASYNLAAAENIAASKKNPSTADFHPSFLFQRRILTPPHFIKQENYRRDLENQVGAKEAAENKKRADKEFLGRLEQVQLAEDIAAQREKFLKDKAEKRESYQRALSAQLKMKPEPIPYGYSNTGEPYFGKNDTNEEKLAERRKRAKDIYLEQMNLVDQKKREAILKQLADQKNDEEVLNRTRQERLDEAADRYELLMKMRKGLEEDWMKAAELKRSRDIEERLWNKAGSQLIVHEQCDRYKRCHQCKRRMSNHGSTNIWCETRYIPGTRIMV